MGFNSAFKGLILMSTGAAHSTAVTGSIYVAHVVHMLSELE